MTRMSMAERTALCDVALQVGEDEPTLCGEWTVKELVVHLLVRERSLAAAGILVSPLSRLTDLESRRLGAQDFTVLVERLRHGPPPWSPYAIPKLDRMLNTLEYFVHHEDIRRAQEEWTPRQLGNDDEKLLWAMIRRGGKALARNAPVGITIVNSVTASETVLKDASEAVTVRGLPSEVTLFVFGRQPQSRVELDGPPSAVAALTGSDLGI